MMKFPHRLRHFEAAQMDAQQCLQLDDGHIKAAVRLAKASKVNWRKRPWVTGRLERFFRESEVKGGEYISVIHFLTVWRRGASLVYQNFWVWSILWCSTSDIFGYFTSRIPRICGNHHFGPPSLDGTRLWVWWAKQLFLCREYWLNQGDWTVKSRIGMDEWQLQISSSLGAEKGIDVVCPATYVALKCIVFLESIIFGM